MNSDYKAGFEAGIRAAEELCRELAEGSSVAHKRNMSKGMMVEANAFSAFHAAESAMADAIAALTPEETDA